MLAALEAALPMAPVTELASLAADEAAESTALEAEAVMEAKALLKAPVAEPTAEDKIPRAPVSTAEAAEPLAEAAMAARGSDSSSGEQRDSASLTCAVGGSICNDLVGRVVVTASLPGAVADTIAKVPVGAVTLDVTLGAAERRLGNADHVVDACLLDRSVSMRGQHGSGGGDDLHHTGVGC